jgi:hypothetical protein
VLQRNCWHGGARDRVSRVEMPVGYSPWHCIVGRRKTEDGWVVMSLGCAVIRRRTFGGGSKGRSASSHEEGTMDQGTSSGSNKFLRRSARRELGTEVSMVELCLKARKAE